MPIQDFRCDGCGLESHVNYKEDDGVMSVVQAIEDEHKNWSPECPKTYRELRIFEGKEGVTRLEHYDTR